MKKMIAVLLCLAMLGGASAMAAEEPTEIGVVGNDQFAYTITCVAPSQFYLYHKQPDHQTLEGMLANSSPSKNSYLFVIVVEEDLTEGENLADYSPEALKTLEASYQEANISVTFKDGKNGMKFMLLKEASNKKKTYDSIETIWKGCAIQMTLGPVEQEIHPMTEKEATAAMNFLMTLNFIPAEPFPPEEITDEEEEEISAEETVEETVSELVQPPIVQPGGRWQVSGEPVASRLTEQEQALFDKAAAQTGMNYIPVTVLATQVVAGANYAYLCKEQGGDQEWIIVTVYESLDHQVEVLNAHTLALYHLLYAAEQPAVNLSGGWRLTTPDNGAALPESAFAAYQQAMEKAEQALSPVALLGTQIVSGMNYKVLCRDENALYAAEIYQPLNGGAELTSLELLDLLAYVGIN